MDFPLKSLTHDRIQQAYALKMKGKQMNFQAAPMVPKQKGIDIDSLLDQKVAVQSGYIMPSNVIITEVTTQEQDSNDFARQEVSTANRSRYSVGAAQATNQTVGIAQRQAEYTIDKHEPIVEREFEFADYQI